MLFCYVCWHLDEPSLCSSFLSFSSFLSPVRCIFPAGLSGGPARRITVAAGADVSPTATLPKPDRSSDSPGPGRRLETPLAAVQAPPTDSEAGVDKGPGDKRTAPETNRSNSGGVSSDGVALGEKRKAEGEVMASPLPTGAALPASGAPKRRQSPEAVAPLHTAVIPATATKLGDKLGDGVTQCTGATTTVHDSAHTVLGRHIGGGRRKIGQGTKQVDAGGGAETRDMDVTVPYVHPPRERAETADEAQVPDSCACV